MRRFAATLLILVAAIGCSSDDRVVLAAGTTLVDSGFIERVLEGYPGEVSVIGVSSLEALALGAAGSAGLLITHLAEAEREFLAEHPGALQERVFTSTFVLVGPESGPLDIAPDAEAVGLFGSIAQAAHPFVSRGDGSGTAAKEHELWGLAGVDPSGHDWYTETGQGMGFTLQVADQRDAYILAEVGAYLGAEAITLVPLVSVTEDARLLNPYQMTLVEQAGPGTRELFEWLSSDEGRDAMVTANHELFDGLIYVPCGQQNVFPGWRC